MLIENYQDMDKLFNIQLTNVVQHKNHKCHMDIDHRRTNSTTASPSFAA